MLINFSSNNIESQRNINNVLGPSFTLIERFKMLGVNSPKMEIIKASVNINNLLILDQNINICDIELRPKGILITFQKRLDIYALAIPYYKLSIYKGDLNAYTFFKDQYFIKILATDRDEKIHSFISKILSEKEKNRPTQLEDL